MALKILFNAGLTLFFAYCYIYTLINPPPPTPSPAQMDGAQWARGILVLLVGFLIINIIDIYRKTPPEERNMSSITSLDFAGVYKNKLILGMLTMFAYAYALPYTGFLVTSFVMVMIYIVLLGERRFLRVPLYALIIVPAFYLLFYWGLDVLLPRGVGVFRNFSLMIERLFW